MNLCNFEDDYQTNILSVIQNKLQPTGHIIIIFTRALAACGWTRIWGSPNDQNVQAFYTAPNQHKLYQLYHNRMSARTS